MQILRKERTSDLFSSPMAQAITPGHPRLSCSPKQALTLYRLLFQRPADLGQLQNALKQVRKAKCCFQGSRQGPDSTLDPHTRFMRTGTVLQGWSYL